MYVFTSAEKMSYRTRDIGEIWAFKVEKKLKKTLIFRPFFDFPMSNACTNLS